MYTRQSLQTLLLALSILLDQLQLYETAHAMPMQVLQVYASTQVVQALGILL